MLPVFRPDCLPACWPHCWLEFLLSSSQFFFLFIRVCFDLLARGLEMFSPTFPKQLHSNSFSFDLSQVEGSWSDALKSRLAFVGCSHCRWSLSSGHCWAIKTFIVCFDELMSTGAGRIGDWLCVWLTVWHIEFIFRPDHVSLNLFCPIDCCIVFLHWRICVKSAP